MFFFFGYYFLFHVIDYYFIFFGFGSRLPYFCDVIKIGCGK